jgi:hypothetical protein
MKRTLIALAALAMLTAGSVMAANAQDIHIGPGGVGIGPHHDRGNCRTIITHRTDAMGNDVTVRRHVCD